MIKKLKVNKQATFVPEGDKLIKAKETVDEIILEANDFVRNFNSEISKISPEALKIVKSQISAFMLEGLQPLKDFLHGKTASFNGQWQQIIKSWRSSYLAFITTARVNPVFQNSLRKWQGQINALHSNLNSYYLYSPAKKEVVNKYYTVMKDSLEALLKIIPFVE